jgi:DegV family protein with EDD domain
MVINAARAAKNGTPMAAISESVYDMIENISVFIAVPTLTYLRRNKKVSGLKALFGSAIGVQPVLGFEDGKMVVKTKLFNEKKNMILAMLDIIRDDIGDHAISLTVSHSKNRSTAARILDVFETTFDCRSIITSFFSPSIGISTGPDAIGVTYYKHPYS